MGEGTAATVDAGHFLSIGHWTLEQAATAALFKP